MISSNEDYKHYLLADKQNLGMKGKRPRLFGDEIWKYQILLRKYEYYKNCKRTFIYKPYLLYIRWKFYNLGIKLGFSIPPNVFGPGLSIAHIGTIVVNSRAKVGKNCRIHVCVNIGDSNGKTPIIGDDVYIAPGVKIFGDIYIANGVKIGANAVVNRSITETNITVAGVPARKI